MDRHRSDLKYQVMRAPNASDKPLDNASTISGFSHEYDIKRLTQATKALSSNPSMFKQTKYLDEIEEILKKRKRNK